MSDVEFPYAMWVVLCDECGPVHTVWEKPGTRVPYVEHCPSCGRGATSVQTDRVENKAEHEAAFETAGERASVDAGAPGAQAERP